MSVPDPMSFAHVAVLSGHELDAVRLAITAAACAAAWPGVLAARAVPLGLIDAVEPAHLVARLAERSDRA